MIPDRSCLFTRAACGRLLLGLAGRMWSMDESRDDEWPRPKKSRFEVALKSAIVSGAIVFAVVILVFEVFKSAVGFGGAPPFLWRVPAFLGVIAVFTLIVFVVRLLAPSK
jgi:hypothetical protein